MKRWEYLVWAGVLLVCLVTGLVMARVLAPEPIVGLIRFDAAIDFETGTELVDLLEEARLDREIAAIVLEVTSPGGLATSSESIFYSMLRLREEKPIVVVIDGMAASGGYYMAAAGNRIFAAASAYVGNIGTRGPRPSDPTLTPDELSSGPYKLSGGSRFDRIRQLDLVAAAFVNNVIAQRQSAVNPLKLDRRTIEEGRIYLGSEALAVGLVDYEGGRSDAILEAADLAGLQRYHVADLRTRYGEASPPIQPDYTAAVRAMVETAPPDAVFLVDSRIPLPWLEEPSVAEQHMLRLREIAPASITPQQEAVPAPATVSEEGS
jgi:protease-4